MASLKPVGLTNTQLQLSGEQDLGGGVFCLDSGEGIEKQQKKRREWFVEHPTPITKLIIGEPGRNPRIISFPPLQLDQAQENPSERLSFDQYIGCKKSFLEIVRLIKVDQGIFDREQFLEEFQKNPELLEELKGDSAFLLFLLRGPNISQECLQNFNIRYCFGRAIEIINLLLEKELLTSNDVVNMLQKKSRDGFNILTQIIQNLRPRETSKTAESKSKFKIQQIHDRCYVFKQILNFIIDVHKRYPDKFTEDKILKLVKQKTQKLQQTPLSFFLFYLDGYPNINEENEVFKTFLYYLWFLSEVKTKFRSCTKKDCKAFMSLHPTVEQRLEEYNKGSTGRDEYPLTKDPIYYGIFSEFRKEILGVGDGLQYWSPQPYGF